MSFDLNCKSCEMTSLNEVYAALKAWSDKVPLGCQKDSNDTLVISVNSRKPQHSGIPTIVKAKQLFATHTYKWINEICSSGCPELSKHYNLKVRGKDEAGINFEIWASLSLDSEDGGRTWSSPDVHLAIKYPV